jgi:hypothetical protein
VKIRAVDEIADADGGAEAVIRKDLEVRGKVLAREIFLGHRPVGHVLESEVPVRVDLARHHRLAGEIDVHGTGRYVDRALAPDGGEAVVYHDEDGVLERCPSVARDEACAFVDDRSCLSLRGPDQSGGDGKRRPGPPLLAARLRIRSPPRRPRSPPPDATVTNSSPFTTYIDGAAYTPAPVLNFHNCSPVFASNAKKYPAMLLPAPTKTTPPAVTTAPPCPKPSKICRHFSSPVVGS